MARNIKRIAHDLLPLSGAVIELGAIISEILDNIETHAVFDDQEIKKYFDECRNASKKLTTTATLIKKYIDAVNKEADRDGITKD